MTALLIGIPATVFGMLIHGIFLRRLSARLLFISVPMILLVSLVLVTLVYYYIFGSLSLVDIFLASVFSMSCGLCYTLVLFGVVNDSPTLALANAIIDSGSQGMPVAGLDEFARSRPFVASRLAALVTSGQITIEGEDIVSAPSPASVIVKLGRVYRDLRRTDSPTG